MKHSEHFEWVMCMGSVQAMQDLGCFQLPGIAYRSLQCVNMLQHEGVAAREWHNDGIQFKTIMHVKKVCGVPGLLSLCASSCEAG